MGTATVAHGHQELRVLVNSWQYSRRVVVEPQRVMIEIARMSCRHCPTCAGRTDSIENRLRGSKLPWKWEFMNGGMFLSIPNDGATNPVDLLRQATGFDVRRY